MNTIKRFLVALVALFGLLPSLVFGQPNNPNDPNTDPNWDWKQLVYTMYVKDANQQTVPTSIPAPWGQPDIPDGLFLDKEKNEGWFLLCRDFGSPTRAIYGDLITTNPPYFALYNKYRGLLRVFVRIRGANMNFSTESLVALFGSDTRTATLTHLRPRATCC